MSTDGDSVWTEIDADYYTDGTELIVDPVTSGVVWTAGYKSDHMAVSRTTNWGNSWERDELSTQTGKVYSLAIDPVDRDIVYASGYENSAAAVYRTEDGGASWTKLTASGLGGYVYDLVVDPASSEVLFAGTGSGIYRSQDGGSSFSRIGASVNRTNSLLPPDATDTMYAGTENQGVWVSYDAGDTWEQMNTGLEELTINALAIDPAEWLFAGTDGRAVWGWNLNPQGIVETETGTQDLMGPCALPNPATYAPVTINYEIEQGGQVSVSILDLTGRLVKVIVNGLRTEGYHSAVWNPVIDEAPPGVYFIRLTTGSETASGRMILIR